MIPLLLLAQTDAFLQAESVEAISARTLPIDPHAKLWSTIAPHAIWIAPQASIRLNDAAANRALSTSVPRQVDVRAAYDDRSLAILIEWSDDTESTVADIDRFQDGAAIQIPLAFGRSVRLPYLGMGDEEQHVAIDMVRPGSSKSVVAAGFGSSVRDGDARTKMVMRYGSGRWRALFVRPQAPHGLVPFAIAIWDGGKHERGGNKATSGWKFLRLAKHPLDAAYAEELAFGYDRLGDPSRGKPLVQSMCAACHHMGEMKTAPKGLAPDLSYIGLLSSPRYLVDSIVAPNQPIVPHLYSPIRWTTMPSFETMSKQEIEDMAAYLWTLGRKQ